MKWSNQQEQALQAVSEWLKRKDKQIFRLFGYAGTGKTTLAKYFAESVDGQVFFAAFTGKAALVLRQCGCSGASTIHSLIYLPKDKSTRKLRELQNELEYLLKDPLSNHNNILELEGKIRWEKENLKRPIFTLNSDSAIKKAELVVIDECSMVDERIGMDLLSFDVPILVLGDPAQLPPVANQGFFTNQKPDFMLEEVHRQALDSPVLRLATDIRSGRSIPFGQFGDSSVIEWEESNSELVLGADQILVGTNKFRHRTNDKIRQLLGLEDPMPLPNDKLVCLRNDNEVGLLNGSLWRVLISVPYDDRITLELIPEVRFNSNNGALICEAHAAHFIGQDISWWEKKEAQEFDYGYALTCHKAQGSQWDHVLIFDQSSVFKEHSQRWLYTAVTRAAEKVTIVRKKEC